MYICKESEILRSFIYMWEKIFKMSVIGDLKLWIGKIVCRRIIISIWVCFFIYLKYKLSIIFEVFVWICKGMDFDNFWILSEKYCKYI